MFVDRGQELAFLDSLLSRRHPGPAQFVMLYGRRRVGKTALLSHWATRSGEDYAYWVAEKEVAPLQRRDLYARVINAPMDEVPTFERWADLWRSVAEVLKGKRHILILDEFPYAADADPAMLSALQNAWDHRFKDSNVVIVLCGSHVRSMEALLAHQSPLFGRMTGQWELQPLSFSALHEFFPEWSASERVAAYASVGGVPAYLQWLDPERTLVDNIRHVILAPGGMFLAEPSFLLYDELRDSRAHLAILKAIGAGHHTFSGIGNASLVERPHLSSYLATLQGLRLVERRLPATLPPAKRRESRKGRYYLRDAYFRFYFRFLAPSQYDAAFRPDKVQRNIQKGLQAFIGQTAFEELAREWVVKQAKERKLPFVLETVGSHWNGSAQVDVVAIDWETRSILLGECTWSQNPMGQQTVEDLIAAKTPSVLRELPGEPREWSLQHVFFARAGFTKGARDVAEAAQARLIDLDTLDTDLHDSA